jgi:hypothetical protein
MLRTQRREKHNDLKTGHYKFAEGPAWEGGPYKKIGN